MEEAGLVIASVALGMSILAVIVAVVIYRKESGERERQDRLLGKQLGEIREQRRDLRRATLAAVARSRTQEQYTFRITNNGPSVMRDGRVWLSDDSGRVSDDAVIPWQLANGDSTPIDIPVKAELRVVGSLALHGRWHDDDGEREMLLIPDVPPFESHRG